MTTHDQTVPSFCRCQRYTSDRPQWRCLWCQTNERCHTSHSRSVKWTLKLVFQVQRRPPTPPSPPSGMDKFCSNLIRRDGRMRPIYLLYNPSWASRFRPWLQKCFRAVDFPRLCRGRKNVVKCFILHVTISYLQHVFNMLKYLQKCFSVFTVLLYM